MLGGDVADERADVGRRGDDVEVPGLDLAKSSTSPIRASRLRAQRTAISVRWRCSAVSGVVESTSSVPETATSGVRSSWLIVARKRDLARSALSAASRAVVSSASSALRSVMSAT